MIYLELEEHMCEDTLFIVQHLSVCKGGYARRALIVQPALLRLPDVDVPPCRNDFGNQMMEVGGNSTAMPLM